MDNIYMDLSARLDNEFRNIDRDIIMELRQNDPEFQAIDKQIVALQQEYPFVSAVAGRIGEVHLTKEEHDIFLKYFGLILERDNMERRRIYFRGHMDAVAYLKKIHAI